MPAQPIGISFIPSADAQQQGPRQGQMEGDLAQAFKILSLRLPQVLGARALAPKRLLTSPGAAGINAGGASPYAAVFQALLQAALGGQEMPSLGGDLMPPFPGSTAGSSGGYGGYGGGVTPDVGGPSGLPPLLHYQNDPPKPGNGSGNGSFAEPAPSGGGDEGSGGRPDYPGYEREHHWF